MWQPSGRQWTIIWCVALLVVLGWPPAAGRSLGVKIVNWMVDPGGSLPTLPSQLPMGLDDDGEAVTEHDMAERAYYDVRNRSMLTRWRMDLKEASDPFPSTTQRQLLVGLAVAGALIVWRKQ